MILNMRTLQLERGEERGTNWIRGFVLQQGEKLSSSIWTSYSVLGSSDIVFTSHLIFTCCPALSLGVANLVELKLASCVIRPVAGRVQLRLLRKLSMKDIHLTDRKLVDILSNSPLLKELSIEVCHGLHEPKFYRGPSIQVLNLKECGSFEKLDLTRSDIKHLTI